MNYQYLSENMCFEDHATILHIDSITSKAVNVTHIKYRDATTIRSYGIPKKSWDSQYYIFKQISLKKFFKEIFVG